jgi:hypothetical protein
VQPEGKAAGFNSTVEVAREMAGAAAFESFVTGLPPELADYIRRPRLATSWIPLADSSDISTRMVDQLFGGDVEKAFEMARRQFLRDLSTIYRVFIRLGSVSFVARRASNLYTTYVRNAGTMRLVRDEVRLVEVQVSDHPIPTASLWHFMRGTVHGATEASGARDVTTQIVDGGGPSDHNCRIRVTWA